MVHSQSTVTLPDGSQKHGVEVQVVESTEKWSEFTLQDGSTVRAKAVLASAIRLEGEFDTNGRPIYVLNASMNAITSYSPPEFMKKKHS